MHADVTRVTGDGRRAAGDGAQAAREGALLPAACTPSESVCALPTRKPCRSAKAEGRCSLGTRKLRPAFQTCRCVI